MPNPTLTEAITEALQSNAAGVVDILTIELSSPSMPSPMFFACNIGETIDLPLVFGGPLETFTGVGVEVKRPPQDAAQPQNYRIVISGATGELIPFLDEALDEAETFSLTFRTYITSDLTRPHEIVDGLNIISVRLTGTDAEAQLGPSTQIEMQNFPLAIFDSTYYPAIQNAGL